MPIFGDEFPFPIGPFPGATFESHETFADWERRTGELRKTRWLYERSLATATGTVTTSGTCGLCLHPTTYDSSLHNGDPSPSGIVPNWREQMKCGCELALINRERALLHCLIFTGMLRPWMRVAVSGEFARVANALSDFGLRASHTTRWMDEIAPRSPAHERIYDAILSLEEISPETVKSGALQQLSRAIEVGGMLAFTAPFLPHDPVGILDNKNRSLLNWNDLREMKSQGFRRVKVSTYWSNEFGYLGPLNFIITAIK